MAINMDISQFLTDAGEQKTGQEEIAQLDYGKVVHVASEEGWDYSEKEQFLKALTPMFYKTMYTDSNYISNTNDVFYEDSAKFGAVTRIIGTEMPEIIANRSWTDVVSGETNIGSNIAYLPVVNELLYGGTTSWECPITFSGNQLNSAFRSASELQELESFLRLALRNGIEFHREVLSGVNRNNWIAEKFALQASAPNKKHIVNIVEEYCRMFGEESMTAQEFFLNEKALRFSVMIFNKYRALLKKMSTLFTSKPDTKGKFIPENRLVFQCLADFSGLLDSMMYSTTFHDNFVTMPLYREVASWQALVGENATPDFATLSAVNALTSTGQEVEQANVVGIMVDKWAILHTTVENRVGIQRDDIKNLVLEAHQFTDRYVNNMQLNGVVFVAQDYTA